MQYSQIKHVKVSKFIMGSNPFSGFSHQGTERDWEMRHFYTGKMIKQMFTEAEALGVNAVIARTDFHIMRLMMEYFDENPESSLQWFAQTCPEVGSHEACITRAAAYHAKAVHLHGGVMDYRFAQGKLDDIQPALDLIRQEGMLAGIAAHNYRVIEWAETNLDLDYYMCCYYNPDRRDERAAHDPNAQENYSESDRQAMTGIIPHLSRPVIHYKIMAAGRNDPVEAFSFAASKMRENDAVCVGIYPKDKPNMLKEDVQLLEESLKAVALQQLTRY